MQQRRPGRPEGSPSRCRPPGCRRSRRGSPALTRRIATTLNSEHSLTKTTPFSVCGLALLALGERTKMPELHPGTVDLLRLTQGHVSVDPAVMSEDLGVGHTYPQL